MAAPRSGAFPISFMCRGRGLAIDQGWTREGSPHVLSLRPTRLFGRHDVEIDRDSFVVAAHDDEIKRSVVAEVELLMRHIRCKICKVARVDFRCKLEPFSPANLSASFHNIDGNLVAPMMMRSSLRPRRQRDCADPSFPPSGASEVKRRCSSPSSRCGQRALY